jgi:hypothetical protein
MRPHIKSRAKLLHKSSGDPFILSSFQKHNRAEIVNRDSLLWIVPTNGKNSEWLSTQRGDLPKSIKNTVVNLISRLSIPEVHNTWMACSSHPMAPRWREVNRYRNRHSSFIPKKAKMFPILSGLHSSKCFTDLPSIFIFRKLRSTCTPFSYPQTWKHEAIHLGYPMKKSPQQRKRTRSLLWQKTTKRFWFCRICFILRHSIDSTHISFQELASPKLEELRGHSVVFNWAMSRQE